MKTVCTTACFSAPQTSIISKTIEMGENLIIFLKMGLVANVE